MTTLKAPFPYYGGKTRVAEEIVALMPSHGHYVEPFFGAGSVLLAKKPTVMETVNDLNGDIVHFFRILRDHPDELERVCALTPHSRAEHAQSFIRDDVDDLERARRVFVNLSQGRNASLRKTGWAHFQNPGSMSNSGSRPRYIATMTGRFQGIAERLLNVSIENRDALQIIAEYGQHPGVLLYVDPPYLSGTRASRGYENEMDGETAHSTLLASVILSGYDSTLYRDHLAHWNLHELTGSRDARNTPRRELIWSNRPIGNFLFEVTA
ncbi:DNA adenine methylase [Marisediminicola sp. LYQ134]|uniref:DNA adenine methylase n=1 Tax=Marisediminicola sp. LYQ134 TaxID=3391061 RepID=UPI003982EE2C